MRDNLDGRQSRACNEVAVVSQMVTLKQIAQEAGVSIMTVSKVMRDYPDIAPKTKERIRAIANHLGYVPDGAARSLRTRSTHTIGVVVPNINQAYYPRVFVG